MDEGKQIELSYIYFSEAFGPGKPWPELESFGNQGWVHQCMKGFLRVGHFTSG